MSGAHLPSVLIVDHDPHHCSMEASDGQLTGAWAEAAAAANEAGLASAAALSAAATRARLHCLGPIKPFTLHARGVLGTNVKLPSFKAEVALGKGVSGKVSASTLQGDAWGQHCCKA